MLVPYTNKLGFHIFLSFSTIKMNLIFRSKIFNIIITSTCITLNLTFYVIQDLQTAHWCRLQGRVSNSKFEMRNKFSRQFTPKTSRTVFMLFLFDPHHKRVREKSGKLACCIFGKALNGILHLHETDIDGVE